MGCSPIAHLGVVFHGPNPIDLGAQNCQMQEIVQENVFAGPTVLEGSWRAFGAQSAHTTKQI